MIAYNLREHWGTWGDAWRGRTESTSDRLTSLQHRLAKTGGRLVKHARYYWLLLAESYLARRLFASMIRGIELLPLPAG